MSSWQKNKKLNRKRKISKNEAYNKAMALCSMQERCIFEINEKLVLWGFGEKDMAEITSKLKKEDFINEERFAKAFAKDKFRFNKWGKQKIQFALRKKKISDQNIQIALNEIMDDDYFDIIKDELYKKYKSLNQRNSLELKGKLFRYGSSRGYESEILYKVINSIMNE